jgi:hypothetical protein
MNQSDEMLREFRSEVNEELGYCSALFMSKDCKGTEIEMPTTELKEIGDRIKLYAFKVLHSRDTAIREVIEKLRKENKRTEKWSDDYYHALDDLLTEVLNKNN